MTETKEMDYFISKVSASIDRTMKHAPMLGGGSQVHHAEDEMEHGAYVYDARGQQVARVRWAVRVDDGVFVGVLVFIHRDRNPEERSLDVCMAAIDSNNDVVEAVMFIEGGEIRKKLTT